MKSLSEIAAQEVGVRESGGNNRGARIKQYQLATNLAPGPWPWCAAFVCWVIREWGKQEEVRELLYERGYLLAPRPSNFENWRPKHALVFGDRSTPGLTSWARSKVRQKIQVLEDNVLPLPNDIVTFDFSHAGIVETFHSQFGTFASIEGNTNGRGERDSQSGDGVWRKRRNIGLVRNYIRLLP